MTEPTSRSSAKEIDTYFVFGCESTNVSIERLHQDKDTDENVDADQIRTERLVESGQSIGLFKQAGNFSVRELVKKIESHSHREALQAELQQNKVYNPFSEKSKKMIQDMGIVELFEWAKRFHLCNAENALFIGIKERSIVFVGIS